MKVLAASEDTGSVKEVICPRGTDTSKKDGVQPKSVRNICNEEGTSIKSRVLQMEVSGDYLIACRLGGTLCIYDITTENYDLVHTYEFDEIAKDDKPISLLEDKVSEVIIVGFESGKVFFVTLNDGKFDLKPISVEISLKKKEITCLTIHPTEPGVFACGGKENDAHIFRLYEGKIPLKVFKNADKFFSSEILFSAKNVKNNHLDLRSPIWISKIQFIELEQQPKDKFQFITVTRYGQLRIYDTAHGRRPTKDYPLCDRPILALNYTTPEQNEIIVSDTHSLVAKFSLTEVDQRAFKSNSASAGRIIKPVAKLLGKYTGGNTGAVFDLDVVDDLVATGGLDRYVRVYELDSREVVAKVYIGTQINSVIILETEEEDEEETEYTDESGKKRKVVEEDEKDDEQDEEDMWKQLGEVDEEKSVVKKKRKVAGIN